MIKIEDVEHILMAIIVLVIGAVISFSIFTISALPEPIRISLYNARLLPLVIMLAWLLAFCSMRGLTSIRTRIYSSSCLALFGLAVGFFASWTSTLLVFSIVIIALCVLQLLISLRLVPLPSRSLSESPKQEERSIKRRVSGSHVIHTGIATILIGIILGIDLVMWFGCAIMVCGIVIAFYIPQGRLGKARKAKSEKEEKIVFLSKIISEREQS